LFWDHDGKVYLTTTHAVDQPQNSTANGSAVSTSEIDLATGHSLAAPTVNQAGSYSIAGVSHIIKRNKYYYLFTAKATSNSSQQGHVSRSEQGPFGLWESAPQNPLWHNGVDEEVQNTSHADVFQDADGQWWAVLSGTRPRKVHDNWMESVLGKISIPR